MLTTKSKFVISLLLISCLLTISCVYFIAHAYKVIRGPYGRILRYRLLVLYDICLCRDRGNYNLSQSLVHCTQYIAAKEIGLTIDFRKYQYFAYEAGITMKYNEYLALRPRLQAHPDLLTASLRLWESRHK